MCVCIGITVFMRLRWNFLPYALLDQYRKLSNLYFTLVRISIFLFVSLALRLTLSLP
jgi:hypothetical protein